MENQPETLDTAPAASPLELGTWIGKSQAFRSLAKGCSAAEAACLQHIRDHRSYEPLALTWEEFCPQHVGISRATADRLIQRLEEFGEPYFQLAGITPISPKSYRRLASAITEDGLEFEGEVIPLIPENYDRIRSAVYALRTQLRRAVDVTPDPDISTLVSRLNSWCEDMSTMAARHFLDAGTKAALQGLVQYALNKLRLLAASPHLAR